MTREAAYGSTPGRPAGDALAFNDCGSTDSPCPIDDLVVTVPGSTPTDNCIYLYTGPCDDPSSTPTGSSPPPGDGNGGGGGSSGSAGDATEFEEGPLAFAVCVLGVLGGTYSIWEVAGAFQEWHQALKDEQAAERMWSVTVANGADPVTQQLYEYQYRQAVQRQRDKASAVSSATRASGFALAGAATVCGISIILPTP